MGKMYYKAIAMLKTAKKIYVIPITCRTGRSKFISLVYIMTKKDIFIFDTLKFKVKNLPKELAKLILSNKWKMVFSKKKTLYLLGLNRWKHICNVCDMELLFESLATSPPDAYNAILNYIRRLGEKPSRNRRNNTRRRRRRRRHSNSKRLINNPLNPRHNKPNQRRNKLISNKPTYREIISSNQNLENPFSPLLDVDLLTEMYSSINWAQRPFERNEHIYAAKRLSKLAETFH
nr:uncharacterized protein LOC111425458 [Onthophagus taurus]